MQRYLEDGIEAGSCLDAILRNDLAGAYAKADLGNRYAMFDIVAWLWSYAPAASWGRSEKVDMWIARKQEMRLNREQSA